MSRLGRRITSGLTGLVVSVVSGGMVQASTLSHAMTVNRALMTARQVSPSSGLWATVQQHRQALERYEATHHGVSPLPGE